MLRILIVPWLLVVLTACYAGLDANGEGAGGQGGGAGGGSADAKCSLDHLADEAILAVTREPPEAPLVDVSHYQARAAARDPGADLNSGDCAGNAHFRFAAGLGDITGPVGANMSGYVDGDQIATGLLDRQRARAFVIQSQCAGRDARAVLVQLDLGLAFHAVRQGVLDELALDAELSPFYDTQNVLLNASHSHNSAGGQSHFDAYHALTNGHDAQSYAATVAGIVSAVRRAHANLEAAVGGPILFNQGELLNGTVNRSMPAFVQNPESERLAFVDARGEQVATNRMMTLLKLVPDSGPPVGMINWYAIHGTSIYQNNTLLSGDNKGYAAYRFEQDFSVDYGSSQPFLAGFMQADEGDASPNIFITDLSEAQLRDLESDGYRGRGGGRTEPEHALISGFKQYRRARELYDQASENLVGEVRAGSIFVDLSRVVVDEPADYAPEFQAEDGVGYATCRAALGVSFGGGAEDGRGPTAEGQTCGNSTQGDVESVAQLLQDNFEAGMNGALPPGLIVPAGCDNPVWDARGYACHAEKPILFPLGENSPFIQGQTLEPQVQRLQIVLIGNLAIIAVPWEVTTSSGRRLRTAVLDALQGAGVDYAVISGLSNGFVHYLTTREEYSVQHYEGASTLFGPWTQEAVRQELVRLAAHLRDGSVIDSPFADPDFRSMRSSFVNPGNADDGSSPRAFGDVVRQPAAEYRISDERVVATARFIGGHPRHDLKTDSSYLFIDQLMSGGEWETVQTDADFFTRFEFQPGQQDGSSHAVIDWILPRDVVPGTYRIRHEGASAGGAYSGETQPFEILPCGSGS